MLISHIPSGASTYFTHPYQLFPQWPQWNPQRGIELISAKELYYEWLRDLPSVRAFDAAHPDLATPPGFSL